MRETQKETAALIVHGGTIMSIMDAYACPKGSYFEFQVGNGEGYELVIRMICPVLMGFVMDLILAIPGGFIIRCG